MNVISEKFKLFDIIDIFFYKTKIDFTWFKMTNVFLSIVIYCLIFFRIEKLLLIKNVAFINHYYYYYINKMFFICRFIASMLLLNEKNDTIFLRQSCLYTTFVLLSSYTEMIKLLKINKFIVFMLNTHHFDVYFKMKIDHITVNIFSH